MTLLASVGRNFVDNLEIYLTFAGLAVIFAMPALFGGLGDYWQVLGVTAIAVGVVHGLLFWVVRRRQRQVRRELIVATREMLADRIRNQLQVLLVAATENRDETNRARVQAAMEASHEIVRTLDQLSLDSLQRWEKHYGAVTLSYT
jgi:hypothetical protein